MIPNARCEHCGEFEPNYWDYEVDGLWSCDCKKNKKKTKKVIVEYKSLGEAMRDINNKFGKEVIRNGN